MTTGELQILLTTEYKGNGAEKMVSDLDKISASGSKMTGVMRQVNKALGGDIFANASDEFKRRNPHLFTAQASGAIMQSDNYLRMGAKKLSGMGPLFPAYNGPPPPRIPPPGQGFGSAFGGAFGGKFALGRAALAGGVAGIAGAAAAMALKKAFDALIATVKGLMQAFENARQLYAKSLTSGTGLNFTARREALASVLGVSSKDVYQFGQAVLFLQPRLQFATSILARTAPNLAATSYEFKILKMNLEALFATMANDAAPALRKFAAGLSTIIQLSEFFYRQHSKQIDLMARLALFVASPALSNMGKDSGPAPNPLAYMKQIQASSWEKMGLVIGGMGGGSPAQETARNTKETAVGIKQLVRASSGVSRGGSFYSPFYGSQSYQ